MSHVLIPTFRGKFVNDDGLLTLEAQRICAQAIVLDQATRNVIALPNAVLPVYADNAAALAGGLIIGDFYRTGADPDPVCVVH